MDVALEKIRLTKLSTAAKMHVRGCAYRCLARERVVVTPMVHTQTLLSGRHICRVRKILDFLEQANLSQINWKIHGFSQVFTSRVELYWFQAWTVLWVPLLATECHELVNLVPPREQNSLPAVAIAQRANYGFLK